MLASMERELEWSMDTWEEAMFVVTVIGSTRGWEEGWDRSFVLMRGAMCCWRRLMVDQGGCFEEMEEIEGVHAGAAAVGLRWVRGSQE